MSSIFFTVRNEVAKVMFLQACVCPQGGGVCLSACWDTTPPWSRPLPLEQIPPPPEQIPPGSDTPPEQTHPPEQTPPPRRGDCHCCGQYAFYWNAFLFEKAVVAVIPCEHYHSLSVCNLLLASITVAVVVVAPCERAF